MSTTRETVPGWVNLATGLVVGVLLALTYDDVTKYLDTEPPVVVTCGEDQVTDVAPVLVGRAYTAGMLGNDRMMTRVLDDLNVMVEEVRSCGGDTPVTASYWREPYGGCKEAHRYPNTRGYRECAERGLIP